MIFDQYTVEDSHARAHSGPYIVKLNFCLETDLASQLQLEIEKNPWASFYVRSNSPGIHLS
jgi:hypothetical protein